jgi:hypothetical protein
MPTFQELYYGITIQHSKSNIKILRPCNLYVFTVAPPTPPPKKKEKILTTDEVCSLKCFRKQEKNNVGFS